MKVLFEVSNGLKFELESNDQKELFEQLGNLQEVFGQDKCGKCGKSNLRFVTREVDGNKFFELRCTDCFAKLSFGVHKTGSSLFPKRKDNEGNYLPDSGWIKWDKEKQKNV